MKNAMISIDWFSGRLSYTMIKNKNTWYFFVFIYNSKVGSGVEQEGCPSGLRSQSWKLMIPKGTKGSNPFPSSMEKYSSGRRDTPAKGAGRETGARVRISPSPPYLGLV